MTTTRADTLQSRYLRLSTPIVYDILDEMGFPDQALHHTIKPLDPSVHVAGPALTARGASVRDVRNRQPSYEIFRRMAPGCVLVVDLGGHSASGPWGENTSVSAQVRGCAGAVLDGGTRDWQAVVDLGFPVFCRFVTPVRAEGKYGYESIGEPITVSGQTAPVKVAPGDWIIGDRDGIVIVPQSLLEEVLVAGERLVEIEEEIRAALRAGEDRESVYRRLPKFAHVRRQRQIPSIDPKP